MNLKFKSSLIIIGTLLIGMILGVFVIGLYRHNHDPQSKGHDKDRFGHMMNRVIRPDETQADQLKLIMDEYSSRFDEQRQKHGQEMKILFDSLCSDLEPILSEDQLTRLKKMSQKRFSGRFMGRGKRGEHPGREREEDR